MIQVDNQADNSVDNRLEWTVELTITVGSKSKVPGEQVSTIHRIVSIENLIL